MQIPAQPDLKRYYHNHAKLAARLEWLWLRFLEYEGTGTRHLTELESLVLQVRLACEHYALLMQSACFESLPGSERSKAKEFDAVRILRLVALHMPHVTIASLREIRMDDGVPTLVTNSKWRVDKKLFRTVYERGGNFLHVTNRDFSSRDLEVYLNNSVLLVQQLIWVTWRHVVFLDGLAIQIISQITPDRKQSGFLLEAVGDSVPRLRTVRFDGDVEDAP